MDGPIEPLDYEAQVEHRPSPAGRRLLSYSCTASLLCLAAVWCDYQLRFDAGVTRDLPWIEGGLAVCGLAVAIRCVGSGQLRSSDRVIVALCTFVQGVTLFVATVMPRGNHN